MAAKEKTRFLITVTQEDIDRAHRGDSYKCVVAQAIARIIPDATRIEIDLQSIRFTRADTGERHLYLTPHVAAGYVVAFDAGDDMHPFKFWITNSIQIARRVRTEAGLEVDRAAKKATRQAKKKTDEPDVARPAKRATRPVPGSDPVAVAEAVKAGYTDAKLTKTISNGTTRPRTFRTGKRVYGSRILRVNRYLRENGEAA